MPKLGEIGLRYSRYDGKIADIKENNTNKHYLDLSDYVPEKCVAIVIVRVKMSGSGHLKCYPNEETNTVVQLDDGRLEFVPITNRRMQYSQSVANDDFDVYLYGYYTQG